MSLNVRVARRLIAAGGAVALVGFVAVQVMAYRDTGGFCLCAPPQLAALMSGRAPAHAPAAAGQARATLVAERHAANGSDVRTDPLPFASAAASASASSLRGASRFDAGHPGPLWGNYPSAARGSSPDRAWFGGGARGGSGGVHWGSGRQPGTAARGSSGSVANGSTPAARGGGSPSQSGGSHTSPAGPPFGGLFGEHATTPAPSTGGLPPAVVGGPGVIIPGSGGSIGGAVGVPSVSSTPEPASLLLMLTGLAGGFVVSRRRGRRDRDDRASSSAS